MLAATALSPACGAIVLHDWRAVAAGAAVQAALLTDSAGLLVSLVIASPALEIERRLHVWLFVRRLSDGGLVWVQMRVLHERIAH